MMLSILFAAIWMAGDSTMCNYNPQRQYPQQGWGQALAEFMKDPSELHNWAVGGRSAKSFKAEGRWDKLVHEIKDGDFVIVAFGHNDANKKKTDRYSTPAEYKELMRSFVRDVREKGATIIFATSVIHSGGVAAKDGVVTGVRGGAAGIGPYVQATRELGEELSVPVLDLNLLAVEEFAKMPADDVFRLYMRIKPGEYARFPEGHGDGCHLRDTGAFFYAKGAVEMCFKQNLPICRHFKNPDEVEHVVVGFDGPGSEVKIRDDFSGEEIAYANEENAPKAGEPKPAKTWQQEVMELRREAYRRGMKDPEAKFWASQEFRRRQREREGKK